MKNYKTIVIAILLFVTTNLVAQTKNSIDTVNIKTSAQCEMCKEKIENALVFEKGIKKDELNMQTKIITVVYKPAKISTAGIREIISKTGYEADNVKANEKAYSKLPACCKKP